MTARELIATLERLPEEWKDYPVIHYKEMDINAPKIEDQFTYNEMEDNCQEYIPEFNLEDEDEEEEEDYSSKEPDTKFDLGTIDCVGKITLSKTNKEKTLYYMPFSAIILD